MQQRHHWQGTYFWPSSATEFIVYAYRSFPSRGEIQLFFCSCFPFIWRWKTCDTKHMCFHDSDVKVLLQRQKGNYPVCLGSLFLSPSVPPLPKREWKISYIHSLHQNFIATYVKTMHVRDSGLGLLLFIPSFFWVCDQEGWILQMTG